MVMQGAANVRLVMTSSWPVRWEGSKAGDFQKAWFSSLRESSSLCSISFCSLDFTDSMQPAMFVFLFVSYICPAICNPTGLWWGEASGGRAGEDVRKSRRGFGYRVRQARASPSNTTVWDLLSDEVCRRGIKVSDRYPGGSGRPERGGK